MKKRRDFTLHDDEKAARSTDERNLRDALEDDEVSEALQRLHHDSIITPNDSKSPTRQDIPLVGGMPHD